ncbi:MAG: hypothetical protein U0836_20430 [Pirellulales bacterium]
MLSAQRGADSVSLLCGSTLLALALGSLTAGTAQADLAAELDRLSQVRVAEFGRDALVREYGKALVRHPDDRARSAALLAMGHLCETRDSAHGIRTDEDRARRYFRAAISAAPVGTEPWLNACLTSFSRELWLDADLARQQLADLEQQFAHVNYYDPDWRRVAAVRVAAARVDYASRCENVFATIDAFNAMRASEQAARLPGHSFQRRDAIVAQQCAYSVVLSKIIHCELPKARRRELLSQVGHFRSRLWRVFQRAADRLENMPEAPISTSEEPSAL